MSAHPGCHVCSQLDRRNSAQCLGIIDITKRNYSASIALLRSRASSSAAKKSSSPISLTSSHNRSNSWSSSSLTAHMFSLNLLCLSLSSSILCSTWRLSSLATPFDFGAGFWLVCCSRWPFTSMGERTDCGGGYLFLLDKLRFRQWCRLIEWIFAATRQAPISHSQKMRRRSTLLTERNEPFLLLWRLQLRNHRWERQHLRLWEYLAASSSRRLGGSRAMPYRKDARWSTWCLPGYSWNSY